MTEETSLPLPCEACRAAARDDAHWLYCRHAAVLSVLTPAGLGPLPRRGCFAAGERPSGRPGWSWIDAGPLSWSDAQSILADLSQKALTALAARTAPTTRTVQ